MFKITQWKLSWSTKLSWLTKKISSALWIEQEREWGHRIHRRTQISELQLPPATGWQGLCRARGENPVLRLHGCFPCTFPSHFPIAFPAPFPSPFSHCFPSPFPTACYGCSQDWGKGKAGALRTGGELLQDILHRAMTNPMGGGFRGWSHSSRRQGEAVCRGISGP